MDHTDVGVLFTNDSVHVIGRFHPNALNTHAPNVLRKSSSIEDALILHGIYYKGFFPPIVLAFSLLSLLVWRQRFPSTSR